MALTFTPTFAINAPSSLVGAGPTYVAAIFSKEQRVYDFIPSPAGNFGSVLTQGSQSTNYTWPATWNGITVGTGGGPNASTVFPVVVSATYVTAQDLSDSNYQVGQIVLQLAPASGDLVLSSSVLTYRLDPEAVVLTVSGTFGASYGA
jgi:hypothetical protein